MIEPDDINMLQPEGTPEELADQAEQRIRAMAAAAVAEPSQVDDPKQYAEAPFRFTHKDNEAVSLGSGSLTYTVTDFVLPGKNGMDLAIRRRYDSSRANNSDVDIQLRETDAWTYKIHHQYRLRGISETFNVVDYDSARYGEWYLDDASVRAAAEAQQAKTENFYEVGVEYSELGGILSYSKVTYTIQSQGKEWVYTTQTRPNDHATTMYGLGQGWSFCFTSIESVSETYRQRSRNRVRYNDYLHLGDGRSYKIDFTAPSGLKGYGLSDLRLERVTGTVPVAHNYILHRKDGTKEYLQVADSSVSQRSKLTAVQDRFGNTIRYTFYDGGGASIVDTLGRTIQLVKNGAELKWTLPEGRTVTYTVSGDELISVIDPIGYETAYHYTAQSINCQPMDTFGDNAVTITYRTLDSVTHPTGAKSVYAYGGMTGRTEYGSMGYMVLNSRKDLPVPSIPGDAYNTETYWYAFAYDSGEKRDYIGTGTRTNADGLVTTCTFDQNGLLTAERMTYGSTVVSNKTMEYWNKLPMKEITTVPVAKTVSRTYDTKGNVLTETDALGNTVTMTYHEPYSLPALKTWWRDSATKLEERYAPTGDAKAIAAREIWENSVCKQMVRYGYKASGVVYQELECNGAGQMLRETIYQYQSDQDVFVRQKTIGGMGRDIQVYNAYGNVLSKTDPNSNTTSYVYDSLGRVTRETHPDSAFRTKSYSVNPSYIVETDENGNAKRSDYTPLGQVRTVSIPATGTTLTTYTYDLMERVMTETVHHPAPQGNAVTTYTYDHFGRLKGKSTAGTGVSYQETYTYDDTQIKETKIIAGDNAAPSVTTVTVKDKLGRVTEETIGASKATYTYDYVGNKLTTQTTLDAARGVFTGRWGYDFASRVVREINALGQNLTTDYDGLGNKTSTTDYKGNATAFTYDIFGRMLTQTSPFDGASKAIVKYAYDAVGNMIRQEALCSAPGQAQQWRKTEYQYDKRNRLTDTIFYDDYGTETRNRTVYDAVGNKVTQYTSMVDNDTGLALKISYTYDRFGNVTGTTDTLGQQEIFQYDNTGVLQSQTERNGTLIRYTYDALGRVLMKIARDTKGVAETVTCAYTKTGQKVSEANSTVAIYYAYDNMGRLILQSESNGVSKNYSYDLNGSRTTFTLYRSNQLELELTYEYDVLNRLKTVNRGGVVVAGYTYDTNGNRATLTYPQSGIAVTYSYNDANLVTSMINKKGSATLSSYSYTYQLDGNQLTKQDHRGYRFVYVYDRMGRLASEESYQPGLSKTTYTYNRFGSRSRMVETSSMGTVTTAYSYDGNNRLLSEVESGERYYEVAAYTYDANGNQLSRKWERFDSVQPGRHPGRIGFATGDFDDKAVLELRDYDGFGCLVKVYRDGAQVVYSYRPDGLRHGKSTGKAHRSRSEDTTTTHCWDGQDIIMEFAGNGNVKARYLRGMGLIAQELDGQQYYYLHNAHGDVVQRIDRNAVILRNYDYSAFGNEAGRDRTDPNPFRYCGEYYDLETNSIYLRNRYYNPANGRFTTEDIARDGLNWYTYCGNEPLMRADATGNEWYYLGFDTLYHGAMDRYNAMVNDPNAYNIGNYISFGFVGMVDRAIHPEKPLSAQHWLDSAGVAAVVMLPHVAAKYGATGSAGASAASQGTVMSGKTIAGTAGTVAASNGDKIADAAQKVTQATNQFTSNSYNASELFKTQSYTHSSIVNGVMETITQKGPNAIEPIKVIVRDGVAMIVDGHHRFEAFVNLGYNRVPIQYIHENQIAKYTVLTLKEMLEQAFK